MNKNIWSRINLSMLIKSLSYQEMLNWVERVSKNFIQFNISIPGNNNTPGMLMGIIQT